MKPYTELEWKKQLYVLRYILNLDFARNDLEYLNFLVTYIAQFSEGYAKKAIENKKYKTREEAYADYPLFKLTGVYTLTMRAGIQYFEEGLEQVKINGDYRKIGYGVNVLGQRSKWELNEQDFMTEEELKKFYHRPEDIPRGMDSPLFDRTQNGVWQNNDGLLALNSDGSFYGYFEEFPDDILPLPYKDMSVNTGELCPHSGEWITLGRNQTVKFIEKGKLMPNSNTKEVLWELKTPWSTLAHKPSQYPIGYKVKVDDIDNPPKAPISGIWKAVGHEDVSLQFYNIELPMFAPAITLEVSEPRPFFFQTEKTKRVPGEWELIYII